MSWSPYTDLERPPLSRDRLRRALVTGGGLWTALDYLPRTGSTNADVAAAAREHAPEGYVVVADEQTAGRGRLDRVWQSPPRAGLAVSVLLRPGRSVADRGWSPVPMGGYAILPLLAGVALVEAVRRLAETLPATEPGDDAAVVLGVGLNVTLREAELPHGGATSLQLAGGACVDRDPLLRALLRGLADWYERWRDAAGDAAACGLIDTYRFHCATIGAKVIVALPGGEQAGGVVTQIDDDGCLVVDGRRIAAGDVVHLR